MIIRRKIHAYCFRVLPKSVIHDRLHTDVKRPKCYHELVEQGRGPMGLAACLTEEQEIRRVVIQGLKMCAEDDLSPAEANFVISELVR